MPAESHHPDSHVSFTRAVRHNLAVVLACLALGGLAGLAFASSSPTAYTSTALVLVNPSAGNPYAPTSTSVRQDELTSLETEAQVARSTEVLSAVATGGWGLTVDELERRVEVTVPPNTQILEMSFSSTDRQVARQVTDAVATGYLDNRERRFDEVYAARIDRVQTQIEGVVADLRTAAAAAAVVDAPDRSFQRKLANALRNELVSQRAQLSALENSEFSAGAVISPASSPQSVGTLKMILTPVGGALAGLALGCLIAVLLERTRGRVRSPRDVEAAGLPVVAAVPAPGWPARLLRQRGAEAFEATVRRLRATILDLEPRPDVITVAPAGTGESDASTSEAVAESFAKAGHRVVLVRTDGETRTGSLRGEDHGLAQAMIHERLCVLDLLQPSVEPLLSLLPHGQFDAQSRELLVADRIRATLTPLIAAGHLVVIQAPGIDTAEGEAFVSAADLGLVVVTTGRTRSGEVDQVARIGQTRGTTLAAVVIGRHQGARGPLRATPSGKQRDADNGSGDPTREETGTHAQVTRTHR